MNEHVQRYIDAVVDERRALYDRLHALIMDLYPDARAVISYQVPMYKTKSGWIALGYWKKGSRYTPVCSPWPSSRQSIRTSRRAKAASISR